MQKILRRPIECFLYILSAFPVEIFSSLYKSTSICALNIFFTFYFSGFVVDRFILSKLLDKIPNVRDKFWVYDHDISDEKFAYGYLVKNKSLYDYFGAFAKDNQMLFKLCVLHLSGSITVCII